VEDRPYLIDGSASGCSIVCVCLGDSHNQNAIYHYNADNDNWKRLSITLPALHGFSGYYDDTTRLLHIIHAAEHYYMEWPMRSRDYDATTSTDSNQWKQLFPTGSSGIRQIHSFVIDI
jgi:hypothetical protein